MLNALIMSEFPIINVSMFADSYAIQTGSLAVLLFATIAVRLFLYRNIIVNQFYCYVINAYTLVISIGAYIDLEQDVSIFSFCLLSYIFVIVEWLMLRYRIKHTHIVSQFNRQIHKKNSVISIIVISVQIGVYLYLFGISSLCPMMIIVTLCIILYLMLALQIKRIAFCWYYVFSVISIGFCLMYYYYVEGEAFYDYNINGYFPIDNMVSFLCINIITSSIGLVINSLRKY